MHYIVDTLYNSPNFTIDIVNDINKKQVAANIFKVPASPKTSTSNTQRWINDENKNKRNIPTQYESDDGAASMDESILGRRGCASNYSKKSK